MCAALASLASCGTQFVYNRLDWLTHYYLSSQVSLDGSQSRELRDRLESFFARHRRSELPRYATFLDRMAKDAARPVSVAQLESGRREIEAFVREAVIHGAPDAARWLDDLRPAQVDELFESLAKDERESREENCDLEVAERREKSTRRFIDNVEKWTGDLTRFMQLLAEINQSLAPAQRSRTVERLRVYARDLRRLAAEPAA